MTGHLDGTVALVTGASSGIGEATAVALADAGATVALIARRRDRLDELKERIIAARGSAAVFDADIADRNQAEIAVQRVVAGLGRLDIVVNNAGLMRIGPVADADPADWDQMLSVNVQGLLYVTRAALPHLVRAAADAPRHVADVVNISSTGGRVARPGTAVYSLTKFGVGAFSEAVRQEMLGQRVRVGPGGARHGSDRDHDTPSPGGSRRPRSTRRGDGQAGTGRHRRRGPLHGDPRPPGRRERDPRPRRRTDLVGRPASTRRVGRPRVGRGRCVGVRRGGGRG